MCDPATAMLVVTAVSAGAQAYSSYEQTAAQRDQARYQAAVERNNATSADWAAKDALERGAREEMQVRQRVRAAKGDQVTRLAANGLSLDSGSPLAILEDTDFFGELDTLATRDNARREAWGFTEQARNFRASADLYSRQARAAKPGRAVAISLLGSAPSVASAWGKAFPGGGSTASHESFHGG